MGRPPARVSTNGPRPRLTSGGPALAFTQPCVAAPGGGNGGRIKSRERRPSPRGNVGKMFAGEDVPSGRSIFGIAGWWRPRPIVADRPTPSDQGVSAPGTVIGLPEQPDLPGSSVPPRRGDLESLGVAISGELLRMIRIGPARAISGDEHAIVACQPPDGRSIFVRLVGPSKAA